MVVGDHQQVSLRNMVPQESWHLAMHPTQFWPKLHNRLDRALWANPPHVISQVLADRLRDRMEIARDENHGPLPDLEGYECT